MSKKHIIFLAGLISICLVAWFCSSRFVNEHGSKYMAEQAVANPQQQNTPAVFVSNSKDNAPVLFTDKADQPSRWIFRIRKTAEGEIVINGSIPDSPARHRVITHAMTRFGVGSVQDELAIDASVPDEMIHSVISILPLLDDLLAGTVNLGRKRVQVQGSVETETDRQLLNELLQQMLPGWKITNNASVSSGENGVITKDETIR